MNLGIDGIQISCHEVWMPSIPILVIYGTAQFKLEARVRVTCVCFVAPRVFFKIVRVCRQLHGNFACHTHTCDVALHARVRVTRVYFVVPLEYFSKSCVSVDNCTRISRAMHARVMSPYMLAYVGTCMHAHLH